MPIRISFLLVLTLVMEIARQTMHASEVLCKRRRNYRTSGCQTGQQSLNCGAAKPGNVRRSEPSGRMRWS